jgi:hypothetical protein
MKNRSFPWVAVISVLAIVAIVISILPNLGLFPSATATPRNTSTSSVTATLNVCSPENVQPVALQFNAFGREFDDYRVLAENTPSQDLGPSITELQRIRRNAEDFELPICLATLWQLQITYMNTFIDALVNLYSINTNETLTQDQLAQVFATVSQQVAAADQLREQYWDELARVLGVTRVPSPTVPSGTETPSATP